ncbi:hypothetical protein EVAR_22886_1 [Eumeta japonica]|uniref:Uncharacterized protein n=1 Tax=Eumeta variegata TaxID=151549 RepID=A0A4C1UVG4_EUMVA|nr:hypothetical protein EVAR_22886_1 [Eumeta japonica]
MRAAGGGGGGGARAAARPARYYERAECSAPQPHANKTLVTNLLPRERQPRPRSVRSAHVHAPRDNRHARRQRPNASDGTVLELLMTDETEWTLVLYTHTLAATNGSVFLQAYALATQISKNTPRMIDALRQWAYTTGAYDSAAVAHSFGARPARNWVGSVTHMFI